MEQTPKSNNIVWSPGDVSRMDREALLGQCGCVIWLTGFSGSGKSTLARNLENQLIASHQLAYVLDGDNVRHGLNSDLGFSPEDRHENIRRIGEVSALFADAGVIVITAFISPYAAERAHARKVVGDKRFVEVFVDAAIDECERRDPKGLYKKARAGQLRDFTGIDAPYEKPVNPKVVLETAKADANACVATLLAYLRSVHLIGKRPMPLPGVERLL